MDFNTQYRGLVSQAKQNKARYQAAMNEAERGVKENRLTPQGAHDMKTKAQREYDAKRGELRQSYSNLVTTERANLAKGLTNPPAGVLASDWRNITKETHEADSLAGLIDRAVMFNDAGLARGIAARSYRRFMESGENIEHLAKLYDLDSQTAAVVDFEAAHGVFRPSEVKVMGPFGGAD